MSMVSEVARLTLYGPQTPFTNTPCLLWRGAQRDAGKASSPDQPALCGMYLFPRRQQADDATHRGQELPISVRSPYTVPRPYPSNLRTFSNRQRPRFIGVVSRVKFSRIDEAAANRCSL